MLAEPTDPGVRVQQVLHDSGFRSSRSPGGERSKSPSQVPAIDATHTAHSAWDIGGGTGSITTRTSRCA